MQFLLTCAVIFFSPCRGLSPCLLLQPKAEQLFGIFHRKGALPHSEIGLRVLKVCRGRGRTPPHSVAGEHYENPKSVSRHIEVNVPTCWGHGIAYETLVVFGAGCMLINVCRTQETWEKKHATIYFDVTKVKTSLNNTFKKCGATDKKIIFIFIIFCLLSCSVVLLSCTLYVRTQSL